MSSFSSFLEQQGLSSERLFWASARVERFGDEVKARSTRAAAPAAPTSPTP
jgi:hypothetical protein